MAKQPKTKKGKALLSNLIAGGFAARGFCAEQYGSKRLAYLHIASPDAFEDEVSVLRHKVESHLTKLGYKVNPSYNPGGSIVEVLLGYYDEKYDGFVEL
jgi:hypothetical protein